MPSLISPLGSLKVTAQGRRGLTRPESHSHSTEMPLVLVGSFKEQHVGVTFSGLASLEKEGGREDGDPGGRRRGGKPNKEKGGL